MKRQAQPAQSGADCGFTLVEIMVTLGIVMVLSTIAMPKFMKARENSRVAEATSQLEMISTAVLQLAWDTGMFPNEIPRTTIGNEECWDLTVKRAGLLGTTSKFTGWQGPYISEIPKDPWGSLYFFDPDYLVNGKNCSVVGSFGPNRLGKNRYDSDDIVRVVKK